MFAQLTSGLDFHGKALVLRAERQRVIASNIANADTPGYVGRDLDFKKAMENAVDSKATSSAATGSLLQGASHSRHIPLTPKAGELGGAGSLAYTTPSQPSMDNNSVDMDRERSSFMDNAVHYESTLRFINGHSKTILSAIQGQ